MDAGLALTARRAFWGRSALLKRGAAREREANMADEVVQEERGDCNALRRVAARGQWLEEEKAVRRQTTLF
jgi:hypothetical protein